MAHRLILDTGVIVALKRGKLAPADAYLSADDVAVAAVTIAGLACAHPLSPGGRLA